MHFLFITCFILLFYFIILFYYFILFYFFDGKREALNLFNKINKKLNKTIMLKGREGEGGLFAVPWAFFLF